MVFSMNCVLRMNIWTWEYLCLNNRVTKGDQGIIEDKHKLKKKAPEKKNSPKQVLFVSQTNIFKDMSTFNWALTARD